MDKPPQTIGESKTTKIKKEDKYGPEAIKQEIDFKSTKIRKWALENNLVEGKDFKVIESIKNIETDDKSIAPHELRQFFVLIQENNFKTFKEYFSGQYREERERENPNNKDGGPTLDYSWGGRFAVINDGVFFDIGVASNLEEGNISANTHHQEFKDFFKQEAKFDFPTSEILNPILKEMSEKGLGIYKSVLERLKEIKDQNKLPEDGWGLIDEIERDILILNDAKNGEAVIDLPSETLTEMPSQMRHYADLTYNIEDIRNLDRAFEITGISIPDEVRIDKIFDKYGFDRNKMEEICKEFSESIYGEKINFDKKDEDNFFKKIIMGNNHPIDVSPQTLTKNWMEFSNWLNNEINENPILKKNRENNLEASEQLVKDIPLILSFDSIEKVIPGIIRQGGILSREEAKKKSIELPITMGEFDSTVNLENHISTYFGNIGSVLYGNNTLIIKPEIIEQNNKNFFVIEGDTNIFQGDIYKKDIRDSILPCNKFYEFMSNYIAAFYEKPIDYLNFNNEDHQKYLMGINAPYLHILKEGKEICYSPEIRINQNINIQDIIGFVTWNDINKINEESFKKFSLQIPHINFDPNSNKSFGETVSSFYKEINPI